MEKVQLGQLELSRLVMGHWRLAEWGLTSQELLALTEKTIELGITSFDHADIYGNYSCEKLFGEALALNKGLRDRIQIITKCGIKLVSDKYPERKVKVYDYSFDHIISSVDNSLKHLGTDRIDLLLLHRPAPFFDPAEVSRAFTKLRTEGKVLHFGVSNFTSMQFSMLAAHVDMPLVTNQVEISPYCLEHFVNGNIDFFLKENIKPMAWSPLAGGQLVKPEDEKAKRIFAELKKVAEELGGCSVDEVIFAWLLNHPAGILPILGTSKFDRVALAAGALKLKLSLEQWYKIYIASTGSQLP
ncbi:MAG: aldo/keto reductase [Cyclobacteriaceae bacterium]|nr:aldo/keto reductase [Cyclobacteriaceae bacterium]